MVATNNWRFHVKRIIFVYWTDFQNPHSCAKTSRSNNLRNIHLLGFYWIFMVSFRSNDYSWALWPIQKKILSQSRTHSLYGLCYRHSRISLFISCWPVYSLNSYSMTDWFAIRRQMYEWKGILCDRSLIRILTTFLCVFILNADLFWPPHGTLFLSSWWCRFVDFMRFDHPHY